MANGLSVKSAVLGAALLGSSLCAWADFSGPYAPANWNTARTGTPPAGGGVMDVGGAPTSIMLIGGDDGCGEDGDDDEDGYPDSLQIQTAGSEKASVRRVARKSLTKEGKSQGCALEYTISMPVSGSVSFDWAYDSKDEEGPFHDFFEVLRGNSATQLSDDEGPSEQSGTQTFHAAAGQVIGFRLDCTDCIAGNAQVVISNFSVSSAAQVQSVPVLGVWGMLGLAGLVGSLAISSAGLRGRRKS